MLSKLWTSVGWSVMSSTHWWSFLVPTVDSSSAATFRKPGNCWRHLSILGTANSNAINDGGRTRGKMQSGQDLHDFARRALEFNNLPACSVGVVAGCFDIHACAPRSDKHSFDNCQGSAKHSSHNMLVCPNPRNRFLKQKDRSWRPIPRCGKIPPLREY